MSKNEYQFFRFYPFLQQGYCTTKILLNDTYFEIVLSLNCIFTTLYFHEIVFSLKYSENTIEYQKSLILACSMLAQYSNPDARYPLVLDGSMLEFARYPNFVKKHMPVLARYPNILMLAHPYLVKIFLTIWNQIKHYQFFLLPISIIGLGR